MKTKKTTKKVVKKATKKMVCEPKVEKIVEASKPQVETLPEAPKIRQGNICVNGSPNGQQGGVPVNGSPNQ